MAPAALVGILTAGGFGIRLDGERLIVHPADSMTPKLAGMIRDHKAELVRFLTERSPAHRLWLIRHADGRLVSHSFTPPATEDELRAWNPQALKIEPEPEPEPV